MRLNTIENGDGEESLPGSGGAAHQSRVVRGIESRIPVGDFGSCGQVGGTTVFDRHTRRGGLSASPRCANLHASFVTP